MVAGLTFTRGGLAFVPVDGNSSAARRDRRAGQGQVDPQPPPAVERALPVIPERVRPRAGVADAAQVGQTPVQQGADAVPFRLAAQVPSTPGDGIIDVPVVRGDVEVAQDQERAGGLVGVTQPGGQRIQPAQLQLVLGGADLLAVHDIDVDNPYPATGNRQDPGLVRYGIVSEAAGHVRELGTGQHGDTVASGLAVHSGAVADRGEITGRELLGTGLDLLQAGQVGLVAR